MGSSPSSSSVFSEAAPREKTRTTSGSFECMQSPAPFRTAGAPAITSSTGVAFPERDLQMCAEGLARSNTDQEWRSQYDALTRIRTLATNFGPAMAHYVRRDLVLAILQKTASLRSTVAKHALCTIRDLCTALRGAMSPHAELIASELVARATATKVIADAAAEALAAFTTSLDNFRVVTSLLNAYSNTKCDKSRVVASHYLAESVTCGVWENVDHARLCTIVSRMIAEGHPEVRQSAKLIVIRCSRGCDGLEDILSRHLSTRQVEKWLKLLSEPQQASTVPSTGDGRDVSHRLTATLGDGIEAAREKFCPLPLGAEALSDAASESNPIVVAAQQGVEWRDRLSAVQGLQSEYTAGRCTARVLVDALITRSSDQNLKVQIAALTCLVSILSTLNDAVKTVVESSAVRLVSCAATASGSSNSAASTSAKSLLCHCRASLPDALWASSLAHALSQARTPQAKVALLDMLSDDSATNAARRQCYTYVQRFASDPKIEVRQACERILTRQPLQTT